MKKLVLLLAAAAFTFTACGDKEGSGDDKGEKKASGPSLCECVNMEERTEACEKMKSEWEAEYEGADDDKQEEMEAEIMACMNAGGEKEEMEEESSDLFLNQELADEICNCFSDFSSEDPMVQMEAVECFMKLSEVDKYNQTDEDEVMSILETDCPDGFNGFSEWRENIEKGME